MISSIVAQTEDGKILHARNLDFWEGMGFTNSLRDIAIQVHSNSSFQNSHFEIRLIFNKMEKLSLPLLVSLVSLEF